MWKIGGLNNGGGLYKTTGTKILGELITSLVVSESIVAPSHVSLVDPLEIT